MKIQELLAKPELTLQETSSELVYLEGAVGAGSSGEIHLYPDPKNTSRYVILKATDIVGDLAQLDPEYLSSIGLTGFHAFRASVKRGTAVRIVTIAHHKLGETLSSLGMKLGTDWYPGECSSASDCPDGCCTFNSNGECVCDRCCRA